MGIFVMDLKYGMSCQERLGTMKLEIARATPFEQSMASGVLLWMSEAASSNLVRMSVEFCIRWNN